MLSAIGYVVIAMAVFDVAKYFVEEEVIRGREMRSASEARRSLTKFVSTIAIAVFIEGLVIVFQASKESLPEMLYPTALLLTAIVIVVGLGVYQRLSADVEEKVEDPGKPSQVQGALSRFSRLERPEILVGEARRVRHLDHDQCRHSRPDDRRCSPR